MRKITFLLSFLLLSNFAFGQKHESEIKKSINNFFEAMYARDTTTLKNLCHLTKELQTMALSPKGDYQLRPETMEKFITSIGSIPKDLKLEERLTEIKILEDYPLAHAWTPYEFYVNDKLSHTGTNSFVMIHHEGIWKIIHLADTRRK
jgi:hypothetical protein